MSHFAVRHSVRDNAPVRFLEIVYSLQESASFRLDNIQYLFNDLVLEGSFRLMITLAIHVDNPEHALISIVVLELWREITIARLLLKRLIKGFSDVRTEMPTYWFATTKKNIVLVWGLDKILWIQYLLVGL